MLEEHVGVELIVFFSHVVLGSGKPRSAKVARSLFSRAAVGILLRGQRTHRLQLLNPKRLAEIILRMHDALPDRIAIVVFARRLRLAREEARSPVSSIIETDREAGVEDGRHAAHDAPVAHLAFRLVHAGHVAVAGPECVRFGVRRAVGAFDEVWCRDVFGVERVGGAGGYEEMDEQQAGEDLTEHGPGAGDGVAAHHWRWLRC